MIVSDHVVKGAVLGATVLLCGIAPNVAVSQEPSSKAASKPPVRERLDTLEKEVSELWEDARAVSGEDPPEEIRARLEALETSLRRLSKAVAEMQAKEWKREDEAEEQDARLDDLAEETSLIWKDVDAVKAAAKEAERSPSAGYDNGFYIRSKDAEYGLTLTGFVHPFYRLGIQWQRETDELGNLIGDGEGSQERLSSIATNGFGLQNARLAAAIQLPFHLKARLEVDYGTQSGEIQHPPNAQIATAESMGRVVIDEYALRLMDGFVSFAPLEALFVRAGQFRVPFDEETRFLDNQLTFTSRSLMTRQYLIFGDSPELDTDSAYYRWGFESQRGSSFGRDLGVSLGGAVSDGRFNYEVGAFNGAGLNVQNDNRDVLAAVRLFSDPVGPMTAGMSDTGTTEKALVRAGAGFAFDLLRHEDQLNPGDTYNSADYSVTADIHLKWRGLSALASFFFRHSDHGSAIYDIVEDESGAPAARDKPMRSLGLSSQLAYFYAPLKIEPAFRYSLYDARLHLVDDHVHEITGAFGYYPFIEHLHLKVEYRLLHPQDTERSYLAPLGVWYDNRHEITVMAEVSF